MFRQYRLYFKQTIIIEFWNVFLGNIIDVQSGEWVGQMSGVGAGLDSFYEYLLKVKILKHYLYN